MPDEQELWQLIAAPVTAFNEAEAASGARFVELMTEYAFLPAPDCADRTQDDTTPNTNTPLRLRELTFQVEQRNELGQIQKRDIRFPIIQFIPLGGLSIDQAKINFALSLDALPSEGTARGRASRAPSTSLPRLTGRIARRWSPASEPNDETTDGNVGIEMNLRQIDLPSGILDLIHQTQGGVTTVHPEDPNPPSPLESTGQIFHIKLLELSEPTLKPCQDLNAKIQIRLSPEVTQGWPVAFKITPNPRGALKLLTPDTDLIVTHSDCDLLVRFRVSKMISKYPSETPVGLTFTATAKDIAKEQEAFLELPRFNHAP